MRRAWVVPPCRSMASPVSDSSPALAMLPPAPRTMSASIRNAPSPACSIRPSRVSRVAADRDRAPAAAVEAGREQRVVACRGKGAANAGGQLVRGNELRGRIAGGTDAATVIDPIGRIEPRGTVGPDAPAGVVQRAARIEHQRIGAG